MAITVNTDPTANRHVTGITTGNEHIWKVRDNSTVTIECIETSAGTATVKTSISATEPTDFTNFSPSAIGAHSATFTEHSTTGLKWIGLDVASGTWSINIEQNKTI